MKQEKILVVEDNFINAICAITGLSEYKNIDDVLTTGNYGLTMENLDEYKPTAALVDLNFPGYSGKELPGQAIGKELKKRGIPYLYVTGVSEEYGHDHTNIVAIEVKCDKCEGLETLLQFDKVEKDPEIWQAAYDKLNELYGESVE
ncbi:MAG: hypothetical protein U9R34_05275 [Nanoarchaeota archaeon]|nr:hypothetical protein [Nanoarchaeota archaeon]